MTQTNNKSSYFNQSYQETTDRLFTIHTGLQGMEMIHSAIQKANDKDHALFLMERKEISKEEYDNIIAMISSSDPENYEVAKAILYNLKTKPWPSLSNPTITPTKA